MSWKEDYSGFRLSLTRWGGLFLLMVIMLGFAAVNTGNNGLMSLVGVALGSYVISGVWSRQVLGKIRIKVDFPNEIFASRPVDCLVKVENLSRIFPAYGLVISDVDGNPVAGIHRVDRGEEVSLVFPQVFLRRGWQEAGPWRVEVLLPLAFFRKSKEVVQARRILVYPEIRQGRLRRAEIEGLSRGARHWKGRGREGEVFQLRDFNEADEARQIHWKQSARQDRLIATDRRRPVDRPLVLRVDPEDVDPANSQECADFERLISAVATEILRSLGRSEELVLIIGDRKLGPENDRKHAPLFLLALAELEAGESWAG